VLSLLVSSLATGVANSSTRSADIEPVKMSVSEGIVITETQSDTWMVSSLTFRSTVRSSFDGTVAPSPIVAVKSPCNPCFAGGEM